MRRLHIVMLVRHLGYVRLFDPVIRGLLDRGHQVDLRYERDGGSDRELAWLRRLDAEPGFASAPTRAMRGDRWYMVRHACRRFGDYVWFLAPELGRIPFFVAIAEDRAGSLFTRLVRRPCLASERFRLGLWGVLRRLEDALPPVASVEAELRGAAPDVLVLVPHLMPGNMHSEYVRAAREASVPTCVCVASWDNLTTKQHLREAPDRLLVWNDLQRREAVELHGIPDDRVVVTGAQSFDQWFSWTPTPREEFCRRVGLDPGAPYLLYLGGALLPTTMTEARFVRERWIPRLREDERLREAGILVRPHPDRAGEWDAAAFDGLAGVAVWPRTERAMPVDDESRQEFFDSIHHSAAVVGLNTTAMLEAAAIGRAVHTITVPEFTESQEDLLHFRYLQTVGGGLLEQAATWEEHCDGLALAVAGADPSRERRMRFLEEFVRPHGIEEAALPRVLDAIEATAALGPLPVAAPSALQRSLRLVLRSGLWGVRRARRAQRALARRGGAAPGASGST